VANRLLDTNIVSFLFKGHALAARYVPHLTGHSLVLSFMSLAELYEGARRARWSTARFARMRTRLTSYTVLFSTPQLCERWGEIRFQRRSQPIDGSDAWIAATAIEYDCELVTHNPKDFHGISGLTVITEAP
jgi:predicted nucleic acid-binding protein